MMTDSFESSGHPELMPKGFIPPSQRQPVTEWLVLTVRESLSSDVVDVPIARGLYDTILDEHLRPDFWHKAFVDETPRTVFLAEDIDMTPDAAGGSFIPGLHYETRPQEFEGDPARWEDALREVGGCDMPAFFEALLRAEVGPTVQLQLKHMIVRIDHKTMRVVHDFGFTYVRTQDGDESS